MHVICRTPPINAQCWSMPINADQNYGIDSNVDQFRSMPIKNWEELIGIDRQWSALRDISDQFHDIDRHWSTLIDIDLYWAMIVGVLSMAQLCHIHSNCATWPNIQKKASTKFKIYSQLILLFYNIIWAFYFKANTAHLSAYLSAYLPKLINIVPFEQCHHSNSNRTLI